MSNYEQKPGQIAVFVNDKGDNEKRPDMTGTAVLEDGTVLKVSLWAKKTDAGMKYLTGKIQPKESGSFDQAATANEVLDDLPF
jgi:hypothetical protein